MDTTLLGYGIATVCATALLVHILPIRKFAPWVPSRMADIDALLRQIDIPSGSSVIDLGCGDGRFVFAVARQPNIRATGVELLFPLYWYCRLKKLFFRGKSIPQFIRGDLFKVDLSVYDLVFIFGLPKPIAHYLKGKLEKELRPGSRVLSMWFSIEGWQPTRIILGATSKDSKIYLYQR